MNPTFLSALGNHLWQSTVFAALAGLLTLMLRKHGAHVRYWVWFTASVKFLVPFSLLISLGSAVRWPFTLPTSAPHSVAIVATQIAQPFVPSTSAPLPSSPLRATWYYVLATLFFIAWLLGFLIILALWARNWRRMRKIIGCASPVVIPPNIHGNGIDIWATGAECVWSIPICAAHTA